ncbi:MAG: hypothetical protein M3O62_10710 [Pseudomonadota bacterium]|nr:hypothetical protein [Pseudomonadota bacterium]
MKLRIEYLDHNEHFATLLPREGRVVATPECADSALAWHLIHLDKPLLYEATAHTHFLVASRWQGQAVGEPVPTSVFILLVPSAVSVEDGFSHKHFLHAAWGMAHVVEDSRQGADIDIVQATDEAKSGHEDEAT